MDMNKFFQNIDREQKQDEYEFNTEDYDGHTIEVPIRDKPVSSRVLNFVDENDRIHNFTLYGYTNDESTLWYGTRDWCLNESFPEGFTMHNTDTGEINERQSYGVSTIYVDQHTGKRSVIDSSFTFFKFNNDDPMTLCYNDKVVLTIACVKTMNIKVKFMN